MTRNMDLIRNILLKIEEHEHGRAPRHLAVDGYNDEQIGYHVHLMGQAGLLKVAEATTFASTSPRAIPIHMTWEGHEYLDAIRSDTVWHKTKNTFVQAGTAMTFELVKTVAIMKGKELLGV